MFEFNIYINKFIKFSNPFKNLNQSTNSLDSISEIESNEEQNISLPPKRRRRI